MKALMFKAAARSGVSLDEVYSALGINSSSSADEIKKAKKIYAFKNHPDKTKSSTGSYAKIMSGFDDFFDKDGTSKNSGNPFGSGFGSRGGGSPPRQEPPRNPPPPRQDPPKSPPPGNSNSGKSSGGDDWYSRWKSDQEKRDKEWQDRWDDSEKRRQQRSNDAWNDTKKKNEDFFGSKPSSHTETGGGGSSPPMTDGEGRRVPQNSSKSNIRLTVGSLAVSSLNASRIGFAHQEMERLQRAGKGEEASIAKKIRDRSAIGQGLGYAAGLYFGSKSKSNLAFSGMLGQTLGGAMSEMASSKDKMILESKRHYGR